MARTDNNSPNQYFRASVAQSDAVKRLEAQFVLENTRKNNFTVLKQLAKISHERYGDAEKDELDFSRCMLFPAEQSDS